MAEISNENPLIDILPRIKPTPIMKKRLKIEFEKNSIT
jgi:hypothetical protein